MKMKIPSSVSKMLTNKYVLYIIAFLAFTSTFGYMLMGNINAVILFALVGYIMTFFSKNMALILLVPLITTNFMVAGMAVKEGLDNMNMTDEEKAAVAEKKEDKKEEVVATASADTSASEGSTDPAISDAADKIATKKADVAAKVDSNATATATPPPESFEVGRKNSSKGGSRIDYGATIETAYDDLNNILGGENIQKLTSDTQRLMKQQLQLADAMKQMGPIMGQAKGMLEGMKGAGFDKILGMLGSEPK